MSERTLPDYRGREGEGGMTLCALKMSLATNIRSIIVSMEAHVHVHCTCTIVHGSDASWQCIYIVHNQQGHLKGSRMVLISAS